jgi:hypothetical protein
MQEPKPLSPKVLAYLVDAGDVAARSVEARNETVLNRVIAGPEDDRNGRGRGLGGESRRAPRCDNDGHSTADQIGRQFLQPFCSRAVCEAVFDGHVPAFDKAGFAQPFAE